MRFEGRLRRLELCLTELELVEELVLLPRKGANSVLEVGDARPPVLHLLDMSGLFDISVRLFPPAK